MKVKTAAMSLVGEMHSQLGPTMKALIVANGNIDQNVKDQVEKKMESSPMTREAATVARTKSCLISKNNASDSENEGAPGFEIPKTDIVAALPSGCIKRLVSCENHF